MSAQRRTVPRDTPNSRAACDVDSPRRLTLESLAMGVINGIWGREPKSAPVLHRLFVQREPRRRGHAATTIRAMARRPASIGVVAMALALAVPGCGNDQRKLPAACVGSAGAIATALHTAPRHVALTDGTSLSECVDRARSDADLQNLGAIYTEVADALAVEVPTSDRAALELGYLVG